MRTATSEVKIWNRSRFRAADAARSGGTGPVLVDAASVPRVSGGSEALAALNAQRVRAGLPALGPAVLEADAQRFDAEPFARPLQPRRFRCADRLH